MKRACGHERVSSAPSEDGRTRKKASEILGRAGSTFVLARRVASPSLLHKSHYTMKRKRRSHADQRQAKKAKLEDTRPQDRPTWPLLRYYYPQVSSLRTYLAAKLSNTSKRRCRILLRYGRVGATDNSASDDALVHLLDNTVVGSFKTSAALDLNAIERDITVYTQQLSNPTTTIGPTQGALEQSEVGVVQFLFAGSLWALSRHR